LTELVNPIARENGTERIVLVDEVRSGIECDCRCLFCDVALVARKGLHKIHHFAHHAKEVDQDKPCLASFERALFWMARTIFEDSDSLYLPEFYIRYRDLELELKKTFSIEAKEIQYKNVEFPELIISKQIDTTVITTGHTKLAIRLFYSKGNFQPECESYLWDGSYIPSLSIDLSHLFDVFLVRRSGFRQVIQSHLLEDNKAKSWLFHPHQPFYEAEFEKLKAKNKPKQTITPEVEPLKVRSKPKPENAMEAARQRFKKKMRESGY